MFRVDPWLLSLFTCYRFRSQTEDSPNEVSSFIAYSFSEKVTKTMVDAFSKTKGFRRYYFFRLKHDALKKLNLSLYPKPKTDL
jgi:hypothetical protein